jgi:hypothetical protein
VGRTSPGCELSDPRQRVAPLKGFVQLTRKRRVKSIFVSGGATARGVRVGNRLRAVRAAYPGVRADRSTEATFGIALATVPRGKGGLLQFTVGAKTNRVQGIAIPRVAFCE